MIDARHNAQIDPDFFSRPFKLGNLEIPNRVLLSPLAGVSDVPFRRICQDLGAGLTYVEMLSAVAINRGHVHTKGITDRHASESMLGVQVTGPSTEEVAQAAGTLEKMGFETIDINMGCPVRKIVNKGCGSAILKDPDRVRNTVVAASSAVDVPVSAKIRIGYTEETINAAEISGLIAQAGADMLTIHGRTRDDNYSHPVNYHHIENGIDQAREKSRHGIITVGNGNVMNYRTACYMVEQTRCDAVLISRGALGNPWIFSQIVGGHAMHPVLEDWLEVVMRHLDYQEEQYGDGHYAAIRFRKHLMWYVTGFPNSRKLRGSLSTLNTLTDIRVVLREYVKTIPAGVRRYDPSSSPSSELTQHCFDPKYDMDRKLDRGVEAVEGSLG